MERDVLGDAVQRATRAIGNTRRSMRKAMPLGPARVSMTPKEARLAIQNIDPARKAAIIQRMGPDEWDRMLDKLYDTP